MPLKHSYLPEENIIKVEALGELTISEIETYLNAVFNNDEIKNGYIEMLNLQGVVDFNFSFQCGRKVHKLYLKLFQKKQFGGAVHLAPNHLQFGISHILTAILEGIADVYTVREKADLENALNQFNQPI